MTAQQRLAGLSPDLVQRARAIEQALRERRVADAERDAIAALALAPRHPEVLYLFALIQSARGRPNEAIQALLQAQAERPDDPAIYNALGSAYESVQDPARARAALRRACELGPEIAAIWFNYGRRIYMDGDSEAAIAALRRAVLLAPQHVSARTMLADVLRADGKMREAEEQFRAIIADNPSTAGYAWWGLATLKPMPLTANDIDRARRILRGTLSDSNRIAMGFALGVALDHHGDFAEAFATLQATHAVARGIQPFDRRAFSEHVRDVLSAFSKPPSGAATGIGEEAIFIVGLPRSVSTLVEQILSSHSQVEAGGELPDLLQTIQAEGERLGQAFPRWVHTCSPAQWQALGQSYLARTQHRRQRRPRSTDKMPGNWLYVGAILAMLPQARVVICRRDPLETCFGCYRYLFHQHAYTHDFSDLATVWKCFDSACQSWKERYPGQVRMQSYEDLVADPETQIRELLGFCNLPFEEACLNFHATQRRVTTPSAAQVREPLRGDTARAAKYGALLNPLRAALDMPAFRAD